MPYTAPPPAGIPYWVGGVFKVKERFGPDNRLFLADLTYGSPPWVPSGFNAATDSYVLYEPLTVPYDDENVVASRYAIVAVKKCGTLPCNYANTGYGILLEPPTIEDVPESVMGRYSWMAIRRVKASNYYMFPVGSHVMVPRKTLVEIEPDLWFAPAYGYSSYVNMLNSVPPSADEFARAAPIVRY